MPWDLFSLVFLPIATCVWVAVLYPALEESEGDGVRWWIAAALMLSFPVALTLAIVVDSPVSIP